MKIISIIDYKGGVGKTTLTANLAAELAYRGKRVLLLDMDAQCSLTFSFISPDEWGSKLSGDGASGSDRTIIDVLKIEAITSSYNKWREPGRSSGSKQAVVASDASETWSWFASFPGK